RDEEEAVAQLRRDAGNCTGERNRWSRIATERRPAITLRIAAARNRLHLLQNPHVIEDRAQLHRELTSALIGDAKTREAGDVSDLLERDRHAPISRSRFACATTSVFRPIASSSKSTFAFSSRPEPVSSAIVPAP